MTPEEQAGADGIAAMKRIATEILGQDSGAATYLRRLLLSLFNGAPVALNTVHHLDYSLRKDFSTVLLGVGQPGFPDYMIRNIFKEVGDSDASWFLSGLTATERGIPENE